MIIDRAYMEDLANKIEACKHDGLISFMRSKDKDELLLTQENNWENLRTLCKKHKVRYFYLGPGEIVGAEDRRYGSWPAVWHIAKQLGFSSCGNGDQYQINDYKKILFPLDAYGYWDLKDNTKLSSDDIVQLGIRFNHVVDNRPW